MKFITGLLLIAGGISLIYYRYKIHSFTGEWGWAQKYIGGTVNAIVLIGMLLIIIGVGYPMGTFDNLSNPNPTPFSVWQ